ncbi:MAG: hypothetical protein OXO49_02620 [Gammaproteobacteria bacterium]|nr:hypothetical protein [Gammaproteobacteria bacterium]MDE0253002.1 hypothetical protein [Gammaproteobacteria bacterium]MDE0402354.1 hypothetical protein [Gammaproteobacteria bacterium]
MELYAGAVVNRLELDTALESIGFKGNHAVKLITESRLIMALI